ncbi:MAG: isochorismatase family protein [Hyphomicrobiales bacterium]|nr:MAG: isochorismatase family protein [Hyphomicrobiales bacterium]
MSKAPIIVVDLQTGMFNGIEPLHDADGLTERVRQVLAWARQEGRGIAFVQQNGPAGDQLEPGAPGWPIWPALEQADDEPTFGKTVTNAFSNPSLLNWVKGQSADDVVVIGAATNHCIAATVKGAQALGLGVTVIGDAHSTGGPTAPDIIAEHNDRFAQSGATVMTTRNLPLPR